MHATSLHSLPALLAILLCLTTTSTTYTSTPFAVAAPPKDQTASGKWCDTFTNNCKALKKEQCDRWGESSIRAHCAAQFIGDSPNSCNHINVGCACTILRDGNNQTREVDLKEDALQRTVSQTKQCDLSKQPTSTIPVTSHATTATDTPTPTSHANPSTVSWTLAAVLSLALIAFTQ